MSARTETQMMIAAIISIVQNVQNVIYRVRRVLQASIIIVAYPFIRLQKSEL